jgi:hypothetical protein
MAWFYNLIFGQNSEIGLVATPRCLYSPAATMVRNFAFSLGNSRIPEISLREIRQKSHFSMACLVSQFRSFFACGKRQFGLF